MVIDRLLNKFNGLVNHFNSKMNFLAYLSLPSLVLNAFLIGYVLADIDTKRERYELVTMQAGSTSFPNKENNSSNEPNSDLIFDYTPSKQCKMRLEDWFCVSLPKGYSYQTNELSWGLETIHGDTYYEYNIGRLLNPEECSGAVIEFEDSRQVFGDNVIGYDIGKDGNFESICHSSININKETTTCYYNLDDKLLVRDAIKCNLENAKCSIDYPLVFELYYSMSDSVIAGDMINSAFFVSMTPPDIELNSNATISNSKRYTNFLNNYIDQTDSLNCMAHCNISFSNDTKDIPNLNKKLLDKNCKSRYFENFRKAPNKNIEDEIK